MDKKLFDDAIGEVPPSTVDVDAAIARGRRAAWTRRVANPVVAVAAGVVLVAGGAVALTLPGSNSDDPVTAAQVQPTGTTVPTEPAAGACAPRSANTEAPQLTEALAGALESRGLLVGATLTGDKPLEFVYLYSEPDAIGACMSYTATAVVNQTGRLTVSVGVLGADFVGEPACQAGEVGCQVSPGPAGETVLSSNSEDGAHVYVVKADRTVVTLLAEGLEAGAAAPLTVEQLTEVGLEPALTVSS